jgi:hypothetical protein
MRKLIPLVVAALMALSLAAPALADQPPGHHQQGGQNGYEGQPGNQNSGGN